MASAFDIAGLTWVALPALLLIAVLFLVTLALRRSMPWRRSAGSAPPTAALNRGDVTCRRVLNRPEQQLFKLLQDLLPRHFHPGAHLLAQVSLAEFLSSARRDVFLSYHAQRVDFLIVGPGFEPLCAVEYQGRGHKGQTATAAQSALRRDWTKRRVMDAADLPLIEIPEQFTRDQVARLLSQVSGRGRLRAAG